jgi:hypothetical protein
VRAAAYRHRVCIASESGRKARDPDIPEEKTQLFVSRDLVRVVYAAETDSVWSWPVNKSAPFRWIIRVPGTAGPLMIFAATNHFDTLGSPRYKSLDRLMTVTWAGVCSAHLLLNCIGQANIRAAGKRAVVTVSDTAMIRKLFALRPDSVQAYTHSYFDSTALGEYRLIPVHYVDPQLPDPDAAAHVERSRDIAAYEVGSQSLRREITANGRSKGSAIRLQLGDSISLADSSIVRVEPANQPGIVSELRRAMSQQGTPISFTHPPAVRLTGRRIGTTTIVVAGLAVDHHFAAAGFNVLPG